MNCLSSYIAEYCYKVIDNQGRPNLETFYGAIEVSFLVPPA
jgi:hypothetical protein